MGSEKNGRWKGGRKRRVRGGGEGVEVRKVEHGREGERGE